VTAMRAFAAIVATLLLGACAHPIEIRNLERYSSLARGEPLERQTAIGLIASAPDAPTQRLVEGVGTALGKYSARVIQPYSPASARAEVVARITATPRYEGAGSNWFVNFPGLLVLAPSWNGYAYTVDYDFQILLTRAWDNAKLDAWSVPVSLDVRHSSGMLLSPDYNPEVTAPTVKQAGEVLADHIARDIVRHLNSEGRLWKLEPPAEWVAPAPPPPPPGQAIATIPAPPPAPPVNVPKPTPAVAWAPGRSARLRAGATARVRMARDAEPAKGIDPAQPVMLKNRVSRDTGVWWYVVAPGGAGWAMESDLQPAP
jgi:hypothetical protein